MKRIFLAAMAVAALASCNKSEVVDQKPSQVEDLNGRYVAKSIVLGGPASKATASFADEDKINDATIFVYQTNKETGVTIDYDVQYVTGNVAEFQLYFSDQTEYSYDFAAWVNMGELDDEPVAGEIVFADERNDDLMMRGTTTGVLEASAEEVSIPVTRYVGKTQISDITLDWKFKKNALKTFKLLDIYVANAAKDDSEVPVAEYNLDGVYTASSMDGFLYDPMNQYILADEAKYETSHVFYAYDAATTEVVIKAELDGEVMYYHFPITPADNTYKAYSLTIKQAGAQEPLGELPEETIVVSTVTLNVEGWITSEKEDVVFEK